MGAMAKPNLPARRIDVATLLARASEAVAKAPAENTRLAYAADVADWRGFAEAAGVPAFPISVDGLAAYVADMATERGLKMATIRRRCTALAKWHRGKNEASPTTDPRIREVLRYYAREVGKARPVRKKRALTPAMVRAALLSPDLPARDRAIVAVGFCTGMRRSELAALTWADVRRQSNAYVITVARSKTDQEGEGQVVAVRKTNEPAACPYRALRAWERHEQRRREKVGDALPVFGCSPRTIANLVKRVAELSGKDPDEYSGHSFRAGMITTATRAGVSLPETMLASRHKSADVAASYFRDDAAVDNRAFRAVAESIAMAKPD
jgi:integrase